MVWYESFTIPYHDKKFAYESFTIPNQFDVSSDENEVFIIK